MATTPNKSVPLWNTSAQKCAEHMDDEVSVWCNQCERLICTKCIVSTQHRGNVFAAIEKTQEERSKTVANKTEILQRMIEEYGLTLEEQMREENEFDAKVSIVHSDLEKRSQELQAEIRSWEIQMKSILTEKVTREKENIQALKEKIRIKQDEIRRFLLATDDYETFLKKVDEFIIAVGKPPSLYAPTNLTFKWGIEELDLKDKFGTISFEDSYASDCIEITPRISKEETLSVNSVSDITLTEVKAIESQEAVHGDAGVNDTEVDGSAVDGNAVDVVDDVEISDRCQFSFPDQRGKVIRLSPNNSGGVWVTWLGSRFIKHFSNDGKPGKHVSTDFEIFDISANSSNDLFATVHNGYRVKKKVFMSWKTLVNTEPLCTQGLNITSQNEILVCLQGVAHGKIGRYDQNGNCIQTLDFGDNSEVLFCFPRLIQGNQATDDIVVIDGTDVLLVPKHGNIRTVYSGHVPTGTESENKMFKKNCVPVSMAIDFDGSQFIFDLENKRITVFDKDMQFACNILDRQLYEMSGATFDTSGQLWVACADGLIHRMQLKIHSLHRN